MEQTRAAEQFRDRRPWLPFLPRTSGWFARLGPAAQEFERSLIRERAQAGLAAARRVGRTGGRPPKLIDDDIEAAKTMLTNPGIGPTQIAHRLGVSTATLYRYIPDTRTANLGLKLPVSGWNLMKLQVI